MSSTVVDRIAGVWLRRYIVPCVRCARLGSRDSCAIAHRAPLVGLVCGGGDVYENDLIFSLLRARGANNVTVFSPCFSQRVSVVYTVIQSNRAASCAEPTVSLSATSCMQGSPTHFTRSHTDQPNHVRADRFAQAAHRLRSRKLGCGPSCCSGLLARGGRERGILGLGSYERDLAVRILNDRLRLEGHDLLLVACTCTAMAA